jgi:hypothetical protein
VLHTLHPLKATSPVERKTIACHTRKQRRFAEADNSLPDTQSEYYHVRVQGTRKMGKRPRMGGGPPLGRRWAVALLNLVGWQAGRSSDDREFNLGGGGCGAVRRLIWVRKPLFSFETVTAREVHHISSPRHHSPSDHQSDSAAPIPSGVTTRTYGRPAPPLTHTMQALQEE